MLSKTDRKILMVSVAGLFIFAAAGFFVFEYLKKVGKIVENSADTEAEEQYDEDYLPKQDETEQVENSGEQKINLPEIEIETIQGPGLFICVDKCGDGFCQASEAECAEGLNCVCKETKEECPADCK